MDCVVSLCSTPKIQIWIIFGRKCTIKFLKSKWLKNTCTVSSNGWLFQGKSAPNLHLEWKKEESQQEEDEYKLSVQRYMGVVKSVRRVRKLQGHMNGVVCVHFDKKRLISAGLDRCIRLWDVRSGQSIHKFYGHKVSIIWDVIHQKF